MNERLWKLSVTTTDEAEEAVIALLTAIFGAAPTAYSDREKRTSTATVYFQKKPPLSQERRSLLKSGLRKIEQCGLKLGAGRVSLTRVRRENWAESWKRHFKPIEIGGALLVKPSWSKRRARAGQGVVVLDPGLSFGTGQHATTLYCLRELTRLREKKATQTLLDIGTGSGILAIAGAKLGYSSVTALDYDQEAVAIARGNARRNRVERFIRFYREDVTKPGRRANARYSVVCANLISNVLLEARDWIVRRLEPGGVVIVAGILESEFAPLQRAYEAAGVELLERRVDKEWCSATFRSY